MSSETALGSGEFAGWQWKFDDGYDGHWTPCEPPSEAEIVEYPDKFRRVYTAPQDIDNIRAENARLGEENCELRERIADLTDPTLKSMRLEDGRFDVELGGDVVKHIALIITTWFRESGAKNYMEMSINATDEPFERYLFYVQKRGDGAKTPHELRELAEAENSRNAAHVVDLQAECDDLNAQIASRDVPLAALRVWFGFQSSDNANALYNAAGTFFGSTFNPAEYDDVE